jgi:3-oxoacyl-[acyl-carrier-protein] synthase-3
MTELRSRIWGTGHYLPPKVVTNFDLAQVMETSDTFIVERTGIRCRRHAESDVSASDLAVPACQAAVTDAGLGMSDIDLLVMNTITPDHADPGCVNFLQAKLGLAGIAAFDIRQQCTGLLYGMALANAFIRIGQYQHPLIVCSETLSKRIDGSYDGRNIAVLLGDGAGAVVMGPSHDARHGVLWTGLHADGRGAKALYTAAPGSALGRIEHITKEDIDAGRVHFRMDGKAIFENGTSGMATAAQEALAANNLTIDDVDLYIPHQANLRMLEAVVARLGVPREKVFVNVEEYGNMASACLPVALDQARKQGRADEGKLVLLFGFGSGFVWGSALVRM